MMNIKNTVTETQNPLGFKKESRLLVEFAIPCVISMLVTALYNIVDQIFIGQGVGMLGNAATNIAFPFSTTCTAISLLLGIGSATNVSLKLGAGREKESASYAGCGILLMTISGIALFATNAYVFRSNQRGSSLCKTIYTNYCDRISFPDHEHRYE